jgi:phosphoribosylanthranilate isomerase
MRVKICGIRSLADLTVAVEAGADAVGFLSGLTHVSEDRLEPDNARHLARRAPPFLVRVLVTHLTDPVEIDDLQAFIGVDRVQLHGEMSLDEVITAGERMTHTPVIRAVHVTAGATAEGVLAEARAVEGHVSAVILDSRTELRLGGTGITHDWSVSRVVASRLSCPVIMAGGLTPHNVAAAVREVEPYAVDVNSGVEDPDGGKSLELCRSFVTEARIARGPASGSAGTPGRPVL